MYKRDSVEVELKMSNKAFQEMDPPKNDLILKEKLLSNSFHVAMRFFMKVGQCISYFPIDLSSGNGTYQLEFRWLYWRVGYSLITFILFFIELMFATAHTFEKGINLFNIFVFIFHLSGLVQVILFFKLTYHWPEFARKWSEVEVSMRNYKVTTNLRLKLKLITSLWMLLGIAQGVLTFVIVCNLKDIINKHSNISSAFEEYFANTFHHVFDYVEYSFWIGLVLQKILIIAFADVFVMVIGTAVTYRLGQVTKRIETLARLEVSNKIQWKVVRKDYSRLTELCQAVNSRISIVVILVLLYNLYVALWQLFFSMQRMGNVLQVVYFYVSYAVILARIVGLCIFGGAVYEEWKNIGLILNWVATSAYNEEVERLTCHVHSCELSLSGNNFFKLSRGLILEIAANIVTYGLVLIQYYHNIQY